MIKRFFLCVFAVALLGVNGPLSIRVTTQRESLDLLDPIAFVITVINSSNKPVVANFPTAALYDISVTFGTKEVWRWSTGHLSAQVLRSYTFVPGKTTLVTYIWDDLVDTRSLAPGVYRAHVSLSDVRYHPSADLPIHLAEPLPISGAFSVPENTEITIGGTLRQKNTGVELVDPTGAIRLSKRISMQAPLGTFIVRGFLTKAYGETFLTVDRWARAFDNVAPTPGPIPVPTRMPTPTPPRRTPAP